MAKTERARVRQEMGLFRMGMSGVGVGAGFVLLVIARELGLQDSTNASTGAFGLGFIVVGLIAIAVVCFQTRSIQDPPPPTGRPLP